MPKMAGQPKMADVPAAERNDLLKEKLATCAVVYDFAEAETPERDQKRQILLGEPFAAIRGAIRSVIRSVIRSAAEFRRRNRRVGVAAQLWGASVSWECASCVSFTAWALGWLLITYVRDGLA
jgi:hypothetical protein